MTPSQLLAVVSAAGCVPDGIGYRYWLRSEFCRAKVVALAAYPDCVTGPCDSLGYANADGECEGVWVAGCDYALLVGPQLELGELDDVTVSLADAGISVARDHAADRTPVAAFELFAAEARWERERGI